MPKPLGIQFHKRDVYNALIDNIGETVQITYGTEEAGESVTGYFSESKLDNEQVWLCNAVWNEKGTERVPIGNPFAISLERVHFVIDGGSADSAIYKDRCTVL